MRWVKPGCGFEECFIKPLVANQFYPTDPQGVHLKIDELHQALSALEAEQNSFWKEVRGLLKKRETGTLV